MTENLLFPFFTAFCLSAAAAHKYKKSGLWLLCGVLLGITALTRPNFIYLFYAAVPVFIMLSFCSKQLSSRAKILWPVLFAVGFILTISPWAIRNAKLFDEYAISKGYASFILVQRVAFNDMSWQEWGASFVYGLPDFGDSLASKIFPKESYQRFDYNEPEGFYQIGNGSLKKETIEKAGGREHHLSYLIKEEIGKNVIKHVMVTFSLAWRGMWVSKYWGLVAIPLFMIVFVMAIQRQWDEFLIFVIPPWFMLGFHAFVSVNVVRYNLILIPSLAIATAFLLSIGICFIQNTVLKNKK